METLNQRISGKRPRVHNSMVQERLWGVAQRVRTEREAHFRLIQQARVQGCGAPSLYEFRERAAGTIPFDLVDFSV